MDENIKHYDAVFISDLHLGNDFVNIPLLRKFLETIKDHTACLYLVGDIFDSWRHCKPSDYIDMFHGFKKIVYVRGNHDGQFAGQKNPLPEPAVDSEQICWNGKAGAVTHAHYFDAKFAKSSWWATSLDAIIYRVSRLINFDLKESLGQIGRNYSNKIEESCSIGRLFAVDFMIIGHTHYGSERVVNGVRLFNLGSWLTEPFALFKANDSYSFQKVTADSLVPEPEEFKLI